MYEALRWHLAHTMITTLQPSNLQPCDAGVSSYASLNEAFAAALHSDTAQGKGNGGFTFGGCGKKLESIYTAQQPDEAKVTLTQVSQSQVSGNSSSRFTANLFDFVTETLNGPMQVLCWGSSVYAHRASART